MSKKPMFTPWFPVKVKPAREGEYLYRGYLLPEAGARIVWNGHQWGYWIDSRRPSVWVHMADDIKDEWRGLAEKP